VAALVLALGGCSVRQAALNHIGDAIAQGSGSFSADDNPELIRMAAPFGLKLIESLIAENPRTKVCCWQGPEASRGTRMRSCSRRPRRMSRRRPCS
jgi:hypothetical protein